MSVFHLKYRPKKIEDLDLQEVSDKIKSIVLSDNEFQSLLFAGPKGSGKTSAARILSKTVNCLKIKDGESCGKCENCLEIEKGNSLDIIEIDAASNRGIDDMRWLKEKAYLSPLKLKKKVFIIDEVHMLTKEAFNAFLKLIEEPPKDTVFILCTTDSQKIPETVLSRLIKVNFRKGKDEELGKSLDKIIKGEKIDLEDEARRLLIANSDGSFRNLQKTFNEVFLQFGNKISKDNVEEYFVSAGGDYPGEEFEADLDSGETKIILEKLEKMAEKGVDFGELRLKWLQYFHQKILLDFGQVELKERIEILVRAGEMEKMAMIEQLPLELAVIEMRGGGEVKKENIEEEKKERVKVEEKKMVEEKDVKKVESSPVEETVGEVEIKLSEAEEKWGEVLQAVKPYNHSVEAFLRAARPKKTGKDGLVIEVFYKFHKEKLEEAKNRKIVEIGLKKVFGGRVRFNCVLGEKNSRKELPLRRNDSGEQKVVSEAEIYDVAKDIFG